MFVYTRSFANVVTNSFLPVGYVTVIDTNLYFPPFAPPGFSHDQYHHQDHADQHRDGRFLLMPTNACGLQILSNVLTTVIGVTDTNAWS